MPSPLQTLKRAATQEITACGVQYRVRRITSREMVACRRFQVLVAGITPEVTIELQRMVAEMARDGVDRAQVAHELVAGSLRITQERLENEEGQRAAEDMRRAVLAAGVVAYRLAPTEGEPEPAWTPCRIVLDGESAEGPDGDTLHVRDLPGGGATEELLSRTILSMSGATEEEAARLDRFRKG